MRRLVTLIAGALLAVSVYAGDVGIIDQEALLTRIAQQDGDLLILDVRTPAEYEAGHIPGAVNLSHDQLETRLAELAPYKSKDIVAYCRSGRRTALALGVLQANGFEHLWHLKGDMLAWRAANRPLEQGAEAAPNRDAAPARGPQ